MQNTREILINGWKKGFSKTEEAKQALISLGISEDKICIDERQLLTTINLRPYLVLKGSNIPLTFDFEEDDGTMRTYLSILSVLNALKTLAKSS